MAVKVFVGLMLFTLIVGGMFLFMGKYLDMMEDFISYTGDMISAMDISDGISVFYELEDYLGEETLFLSVFLHDTDLDEVRFYMASVRTCYFNGDKDGADHDISLLREKFLQLRRSVIPSVENIM